LVANANVLLNNVVGNINREINWYNGQKILSLFDYDTVFMTDVFHQILVKLQQPILKQVFNNMKQGGQFVMKNIDA